MLDIVVLVRVVQNFEFVMVKVLSSGDEVHHKELEYTSNDAVDLTVTRSDEPIQTHLESRSDERSDEDRDPDSEQSVFDDTPQSDDRTTHDLGASDSDVVPVGRSDRNIGLASIYAVHETPRFQRRRLGVLAVGIAAFLLVAVSVNFVSANITWTGKLPSEFLVSDRDGNTQASNVALSAPDEGAMFFAPDRVGNTHGSGGVLSSPHDAAINTASNRATDEATSNVNANSVGDGRPVNILAQGLMEAGAKSCLDRANQLPDAIARTTESVVLQKPIVDPDKSLLTTMLLPSAASQFKGVSILTFAPNQANGCGANFQTIDVITKPCAVAVTDLFGPNSSTPVGSNGYLIVKLNQLTRVLAVPASNSCVLVKQEYIL